jgi:two-component system sensor histidine kinase DesK
VLLGIQAVITVTVTAGFPPYAWFTLYTLLAIGEGIVIRSLGALAVVTLTAGVDAWMVLLHGGSWSDAGWSTGLTTFLAGLCTYGYRRQFAVIAELKRTREELARTAVSAERVRFSRDLHDLLGHTLSVIVVKAEAVRRLVQRDRDAAAGHAADIEVIGRQALQEVREAVSGYRDAGLALELDRARSALAAAGIECMVSESGPALAPETDTLLSWVVREGVTNVVRHSGARHCHISLRRDGDPVRMEISDDGNGGDPAGALGSSGLRGLGERLAASGGRLEARGLSQGFSLAAEIPFASVENAS